MGEENILDVILYTIAHINIFPIFCQDSEFYHAALFIRQTTMQFSEAYNLTQKPQLDLLMGATGLSTHKQKNLLKNLL